MAADWEGYYTTVRDREPRDTLACALAAFGAAGPGSPHRLAVDLGCGDGTDTLALLAAGWTVTAIDASPSFPGFLLPRVPDGDRARLTVQVADFRSATLATCDLLHAGFSLFFCPAGEFDDLWRRIRAAVVPGGRIACHLLGPQDSWAARQGTEARTWHTRAQVDELLAGLVVERLEETAEQGWSYSGEKFWHLWRVLARVPSAAGRPAEPPQRPC